MTSEPAAAPRTHTSVDAPADALGDVTDGMPTEGGGLRRWIRSRATALSVALLAVLAYLPSLGSSPGRMPADTKLYLYLEPAELLGRASSTLEREQFGGWVPHQQITYLWPSGPWYRLFDLAGVPDWVAHRLWIGTILFAAGSGVLWLGRRLGLTIGTALVAALVYQLSPYLLPYVSRTSLLLLPWAALGWLVGLTVLACSDERDAATDTGVRRWQRWRSPALIALVVATVGSVNATALALVAPAPALWLVHAAWVREIRWRQAVAIAARTVVLCLVVSAWWIAMLVVQSRFGAPVLSYSETLEDVSRNATGSEVLRGLGYWLFYIRDPVAPTTTASEPYLISTGAIVVSYALTLAGLVGIAVTRWAPRRFAALLVLVGVVLAVGVHPLDSPSPLMSLFAADDDSGLALALRSSTRAAPLFVLGIALGVGALVAAMPTHRNARAVGRWSGSWSPRAVAGSVVVAIALLNLPALLGFELVDPAIDRDQDPPTAWVEAANSLGDGTSYRVLQLPGAEFGAFRWGYTVDQPLVALTDRPLVTRDLLPLGSGPAMNLLYALDDRVQEGTLEPQSLAPVARLLGADTIWSANDLQFERFRTPRPEVFDALLSAASDAGELGPLTYHGEPRANVPDVPMLDPTSIARSEVGTAIAPVGLVAIDDPIAVVRAKPSSVLLSGDGDGIVDAAAVGLITGAEAIRYSATLSGDELTAAGDDAAWVIITDTNRDRAHHWRTSQDVHGHTEPGGSEIDVLTPTNADQRLQVFDGDDPAQQTIALQVGPAVATASSYGEPFAYRPEDRAVMAIDGDPSTAWLVGDHGDPIGERIRLDVDEAISSLTLRQPVPESGGRTITHVTIHVDDVADMDIAVELTDESLTEAGQVVPVSTGGPATITVEITDVSEGDPSTAVSRGGVGFVEIDVGLGPTTEWVRPPVDALEASADRPMSILLTRLRVDPLDPWRSDPEPELQRLVEVPNDRGLDAEVTLRLDASAPDGLLAAALVPDHADDVGIASARLGGSPRHAGMFAADGDPTTAWITPFDGALGAVLTLHLADSAGGSFDLVQPAGPYSVVTELEVVDDEGAATLMVPPPDDEGRSTVPLPRAFAGDEITLRISAIDAVTTRDRRYGDTLTAPAAIAEVEAPGLVVVPIDESARVDGGCRADLLAFDDVPATLDYETTVGALLDGEAVDALPCGAPLEFLGREHRVRSTARSAGYTVDRVVLTDIGYTRASAETVAVVVERDSSRERRVQVDACPDGCWVVLGEGYNDGWTATADGTDLGPAQLIDGGFNGWWLAPTTETTTVEFRWTAQRPVTLALLLSVAAVLACLVIVGSTRRRRGAVGSVPRPAETDAEARVRPAWMVPSVLLVVAALLIQPVWGLVGGLVGLSAVVVARAVPLSATRLLGLCGVGVALWVALAVAWVERSEQPFPNAGWTESFDHLHGASVFAVVCVSVGALLTPHSTDRVRSSCAP